ncbi:MAG: hypothetical protein HN348_29360 [Proteobacteria bacterium]|nr:hypothetical protein [Pseudomonadota bacterium]
MMVLGCFGSSPSFSDEFANKLSQTCGDNQNLSPTLNGNCAIDADAAAECLSNKWTCHDGLIEVPDACLDICS